MKSLFTYKKIISAILILCLVNLTSCYSKRFIKDPNEARKYDFSEYSSIEVKTTDGKSQIFKNGYIEEDNFIGHNKYNQKKIIALEQISRIKLSKFSVLNTTASVLIIGIVAFSILVGVLIYSFRGMD